MSVNLVSIGSDNGLSLNRCQAIIWTNAGPNWTLGNKLQWNFNQNTKLFIHEDAWYHISVSIIWQHWNGTGCSNPSSYTLVYLLWWSHKALPSDFWHPRCPNYYLTHLPLVPHKCVSESGQHWFRWWIVAFSAPSHYLNQCLVFVNWTRIRNTLQWNFNQNLYFFIQENAFENVGCQNGGHFVQGEMSWLIGTLDMQL